MDEPTEILWQIGFTPGVTEAQAERLMKLAADEGMSTDSHTIDPRFFYTGSYDRSSIELYRNVFTKVLKREALTEKNAFVLRELVNDYDEWLEKRAYPREK